MLLRHTFVGENEEEVVQGSLKIFRGSTVILVHGSKMNDL